MKRLLIAALVVVAAGAVRAQQSEINRWWAHIAYLSDDTMKGRQTGSPEHAEAVGYVGAESLGDRLAGDVEHRQPPHPVLDHQRRRLLQVHLRRAADQRA